MKNPKGYFCSLALYLVMKNIGIPVMQKLREVLLAAVVVVVVVIVVVIIVGTIVGDCSSCISSNGVGCDVVQKDFSERNVKLNDELKQIKVSMIFIDTVVSSIS